eukprot:scaffold237275_cov16-Prasinocladus_malaysianus.AAC.1
MDGHEVERHCMAWHVVGCDDLERSELNEIELKIETVDGAELHEIWWPSIFSTGVAADESFSPLFLVGFPLGFRYALMPTPLT